MGADAYIRAPRTAPLLSLSSSRPSNPSIPFPGEARTQPGSPMIKKARDLERELENASAMKRSERDDPYSPKPDPLPTQSKRLSERDDPYAAKRSEHEERRQRRNERERERQAQAQAAADEAEAAKAKAAKDKDPDPKKREHTRPPQIIVDIGKGTKYSRIGFLGEVSGHALGGDVCLASAHGPLQPSP